MSTAQLNRRTQEVAVLSRIAKLLTSLDLDDVLSETLTLLADAVGAERGSFFLLKEGSRTAHRVLTRRNLPPERESIVVDHVLETGLAGWVYRNKKAAIVNDTFTDDRWVIFPDDPSLVRSVLCVPFISNGQINGIMTLEHAEPNRFTQEDLSLATTVANQATIAVRNAQLFNQVETHERQLKAVLESIQEPLFTITPEYHIRMVNAAATELIGQPVEQIVDRKLDEITTTPILAQVAAQIRAGEQRFELRDEKRGRDYAIQISGWQQADSDVLGYVIVFNDITALKDLSRMKSQMIQMVSHDLKNPLGVIQGYTQLMLMDLQPDDALYEMATDIAHVTERMQTLVMELLNLERIEASAAGGERQLFDPITLIRRVLTIEEGRAARKNHTLKLELPQSTPPLIGDPSHLQEAVANLIDNAIKYTPDNGTITIRAAVDEQARRFNFAVRDTGYGISEEAQQKLFQRFYRAKEPGTEHISGTGLGLSLVKTIIEQHGGEVWFRSTPGKGSIFGFWLPVPNKEEIEATIEANKQTEAEALQKRKPPDGS